MRLRMIGPVAVVLVLLGSAPVFAGPTLVSCVPGQHALVTDTYVRGAPVARVECVSGERYVDASYRCARNRGTVYRTGYQTYRNGYQVPEYRRYPRRSWGRSALVIGGSAATGAGIGGIIHGKKGALIGAALGGGLAGIHEGVRRR